ncbi:MAG: YihY/virulence factor BrkB family protein [Candidatus Promineofilum sp.]|nr:YihY/virulence factor BrkB family protein [Promineifilum sp.]
MSNLSPEPGHLAAGRIGETAAAWGGALARWGRLSLRAIQLATAPESQLVASSIGFFTLFSVFPLALLAVALASNWLDPVLAETRIVAELEFVVPGLDTLLGANLQNLVQARGPVTGLAALALVWSASSAFNVITRAMDRIWGADINHRRSVWRHRTLAVLTVLLVAGLLMVATMVEGPALTIVNSLLPERLSRIGPYTDRFWAAFLNVVLFGVLYRFMPHVRLTWRDVLPGAILAGVLWQAAKQLFLLFIGRYLSTSNLIYGSVGAIIAFLMWTYVSSVILLFGALLNRYAAEERKANPG